MSAKAPPVRVKLVPTGAEGLMEKGKAALDAGRWAEAAGYYARARAVLDAMDTNAVAPPGAVIN